MLIPFAISKTGLHLDHNFPEVTATLHEREGIGSLFERQRLVDDRLNAVCLNGAVHRLKLQARSNSNAFDAQPAIQ